MTGIPGIAGATGDATKAQLDEEGLMTTAARDDNQRTAGLATAGGATAGGPRPAGPPPGGHGRQGHRRGGHGQRSRGKAGHDGRGGRVRRAQLPVRRPRGGG
jgi:hypothetical protein